MKQRAELNEYPDSGERTRTLVVEAHWHMSDRAVLTLPGASPFVVLIKDLEKALENARRANQ